MNQLFAFHKMLWGPERCIPAAAQSRSSRWIIPSVYKYIAQPACCWLPLVQLRENYLVQTLSMLEASWVCDSLTCLVRFVLYRGNQTGGPPWSNETESLVDNEAFWACGATLKFLTINNGNFGPIRGFNTFLAPEICISEAAGLGFFCTWGNIPPSLFNTSEPSISRWEFDKSHGVNCPRTLGIPMPYWHPLLLYNLL